MFVSVLFLFLSFSQSGAWAGDRVLPPYCEQAGGGPAGFHDFLESFFGALEKGDAAWISAHVKYPLRVSSAGSYRVIRSASDLEKNYSSLFTTEFNEKVLKSQPGDSICNYQGLGIADGKVWFRKEPFTSPRGQLKIIAINR